MAELIIVIMVLLSLSNKGTKGVLSSTVRVGSVWYESIHCDDQHNISPPMTYDGIVLGKDKTPWLGLLRVYVSEVDVKPAVTGIVLVKFNYAIGNAHDIARIPEIVLRTKSNALFTPASKGIVYFKVGRTFVHDDYKKGILNTIAILELNEDTFSFLQISPICLMDTEAMYIHYTNNTLHTFGYTDERGRLEQEVFKLQEVGKMWCMAYYEQKSLSPKMLWPSHYYCCEEVNKNRSDVCIYENGMALTSKHVKGKDGIWFLLGISARGPGCSAPSRFINIIPYTKWILTVLRNDKRTLKGDRKEVVDIKDFTEKSGRRAVVEQENEYYRIVDFDRVSPTKLIIFIFNNTYEVRKGACSKKHKKKVIYRENTTIDTTSPEKVCIGAYKISLHDTLRKGYTCINLELIAADRSVAQVYYTIGEEPEEEHVQPFDRRYVFDTRNYTSTVFINLNVRFVFKGHAELSVEFFGPKTRKRTKILPEFLIDLLENKFWTEYIKSNKINYKEPKGNFPIPTLKPKL